MSHVQRRGARDHRRAGRSLDRIAHGVTVGSAPSRRTNGAVPRGRATLRTRRDTRRPDTRCDHPRAAAHRTEYVTDETAKTPPRRLSYRHDARMSGLPWGELATAAGCLLIASLAAGADGTLTSLPEARLHAIRD